MYFIINQVNRVVAADSNLLELLSVESMDELYTKIVLGEIEISSPLDKEVTIKTADSSEYVFDTQNIVLSGMLGDLTLVELKSDNEATQELDLDTQAPPLDIQIESEDETPSLDLQEEEMDEDKLLAIALGGATGYAVSESLSADDVPKIDETLTDEASEGISLLDDDKPLDLGLDTLEEKEDSLDSINEDSISLIEKDESIIALVDDNEMSLNEKSISLVEPEDNDTLDNNESKPLDSVSLDEYDNSPILIDVDKIGMEMGLSGEEYNTFLNEYIDTALSLEEDLRSKDDVKFSNAAATLSQLSKVLHLPMIEKIVGTIENSSLFEKEDHVKLLYATLARLTTSSSGEQNIEDINLSADSLAEADNNEVNFFKKNDLSIESDNTDLKFNDNVEAPSLNIDTLESDSVAPSTPSFDIDTPSDNKNDDMINLDSAFDDVKNELNKEAGIIDGLDSIVENTDINTDKGGLIAGVASTIGLGGAAALTIDQLTEEAQEETEEIIANDAPSVPDVAEEKVDDDEVTIAENHPAINLKDITPIHFDFQLSQAANDLSLPVELIEEFVNDFIEQAEVETVNMLDAYDKGDLDSMQKIGHLLKGASSNLRIVPLSDTLYKIQFCEDINDMEYYIKDYWGHFISFRTQMNLMSR